MDWITDPQIWLSLLTLISLEIVLGTHCFSDRSELKDGKQLPDRTLRIGIYRLKRAWPDLTAQDER